MRTRTVLFPLMALAAVVLTARVAGALGFQLSETKEQLRLKYDVSATDHGTGRVTVNVTLADEGRLKPLDSVDLYIPDPAGSGRPELVLSMALQKDGGKQMARVHLKKEWAERAEIHLKTWTLDGKSSPRTWYWHPIPLAGYLKNGKGNERRAKL